MTNLKQGARIHPSTAWPVSHACAQPYLPGSGSHGQLFRPYQGKSAWHSRRVYKRANPARASAKQSFKRKLHTTRVPFALRLSCSLHEFQVTMLN